MSIQSRAYFKKDKVCYYSISAPANANAGDYLYLQIVSLSNSEAFITVAEQMTDTSPVYCAINAGTTLVARNPDKFFISFKSKVTDGSKFFMNAYYSPTLTSDTFQNAQLCSDGGANLIGAKETPDNNNEKTECLTECCLNGTGCDKETTPKPEVETEAPTVQLSTYA